MLLLCQIGGVNLKNRLILVEGIPGSGKSTMAKEIKDYFQSRGLEAKLFNEGDPHPADLAWNAYIPLDKYKKILEDNPQYVNKIRTYTQIEGEHAIVAYTKIDFKQEDNHLMRYFEDYEVYNGRVPLDIFMELHIQRWKQFAKSLSDNEIAIFECAYLQNHVTELMGYYNKDVGFIIAYMKSLIETVEILNPKLIYLTQPNICETIGRVARERVSTDKSRWEDWIDLVIKYIENSPYGKNNNLKGFEGAIEFFQARKKIELEVIDNLNIDKSVIDNPRYDWEEVLNKVISSIEV